MMEKNRSIALVTGATGYVGSAIARRLTDAGIDVVRTSRRGEAGVDALDLTDAAAVEHYVDSLERDRGPIGIFVHAAGVAPTRGSLLDASLDSLRAQLEGTTVGGFTICTAVARRMKARGSGHIIGITSIAALDPASGKGLGGYVVAKCALRGMLHLLKSELAGSGVSVEEVAPGFMDGGMNADLPRAFIEIGIAKNPPGVPASAGEVADAVLRLIQEEASGH